MDFLFFYMSIKQKFREKIEKLFASYFTGRFGSGSGDQALGDLAGSDPKEKSGSRSDQNVPGSGSETPKYIRLQPSILLKLNLLHLNFFHAELLIFISLILNY